MGRKTNMSAEEYGKHIEGCKEERMKRQQGRVQGKEDVTNMTGILGMKWREHKARVAEKKEVLKKFDEDADQGYMKVKDANKKLRGLKK